MQLTLPFERTDGPDLDRTLDDLRSRFGSESVTRAARLGRDQGWEVPLLPDG
jgi:DNA polymerase IV